MCGCGAGIQGAQDFQLLGVGHNSFIHPIGELDIPAGGRDDLLAGNSRMDRSDLEFLAHRIRLHDAQVRHYQAGSLGGDTLLREIDTVRTNSYAIVDQELELGLRSIAVPLRDRGGRAFADLNISTQAARYSSEHLIRDVLPLMREAATHIEGFYTS